MNKIRTALIDSYAGAILIALIASSGISSFIQPISTIIAVAIGNHGEFQYRPQSLPQTILASTVHALVYFVVAYLLMRWLFLTKDAVSPAETPLESDSE